MKEFEEKLEPALKIEADEFIRYKLFVVNEKETIYLKQVKELEQRIVTCANNEQVSKLLNEFKYALIQHILFIKEGCEKREFERGINFGMQLQKNKGR